MKSEIPRAQTQKDELLGTQKLQISNHDYLLVCLIFHGSDPNAVKIGENLSGLLAWIE